MAVTYTSADAIQDVPGATYPDLQAKFKALAIVMDTLSAERKAIANEMSKRENEAAAKLRLGVLSDAEKVMYRQILESRQV